MPSILVTTSTYPRWSGDSHPSFVHDLCARLARDCEVTVLAPASHGAADDEVVDGVQIRRFRYWRDRPDLLRDGAALPTLRRHPLTALQVPAYLAALHLALRRELARGSFDAIHAHWVLPQGTLAAIGARRRGREGGPRLVMTAHGSDVFAVPASGPVLRWTLRRADAFTGVSTAVVARARALGLPPATEAVVAPMGVDTTLFAPDPAAREAVRAEHGIEGPLVLFAGRLSRTKGIDVLLDAAVDIVRERPEVTVVIAGTGERQQALAAQAAGAGLDANVRFVGFQPRAALARWYAAADLLVGPSRSEGFGLVFAEALTSGCPVVASDLPAIRDIVDPRAAGQLVAPEDPGALARAVLSFVDDRELWHRRALEDRARSAARFGWDVAAERYRAILLPRLH